MQGECVKSKCKGACNLNIENVCTGCNRTILEIYETGRVHKKLMGGVEVSPDKPVERVSYREYVQNSRRDSR